MADPEIVVVKKDGSLKRVNQTLNPTQVWERNVEQARLLSIGRDKARALICELAIEACDVVHGGGGHWDKFKDQYTATRFAEEAGINRKTLLNWLNIYRRVFLVLPKKLQQNFNWTAGDVTRKAVGKSATDQRIRNAYENQITRNEGQKRVDKIISYTASLHANINKTEDVKELVQVKAMLNELINLVDKKMGE